MEFLRELSILSHHLRQLLQGFCSLLVKLDFLLDAIGAIRHQFSLLSSDLHLVQVLSRLLIKDSSSCSSSTRASLPLANSKLINTSATYASLSIIFFQSIRHDPFELKRVGDRRYPCLTLNVDLNHSPVLPFIWTALVALS